MKYGRETPFDTIESAQQFIDLLIEAIVESKRDVDADISLPQRNRSKRSRQALQLVSANLAKLSHHITSSRRILNHLKTLRRLLLEEPQIEKTPQTRNGNRQLTPWS